jgi:hypothetical protein
MMRHARVLVLAALLAPVLPTVGQAANPPSGSYLRTCNVNGNFNGRLLEAFCEPENSPNRLFSQLDVTACGEEVFNRDGGLQCYAKQDSWGDGRAIPHGSYIDTCKNVVVSGDQSNMQAQCKDRGGAYRTAQLSLGGCRRGGAIDNDDGRLVCQAR